MRVLIPLLSFLILSTYTTFSFAKTPLIYTVDSLEHVLPNLKDSERIKALNELCNLLYDLSDSAREQKYLKILIEENIRQGDTKSAGFNYKRLLVSYFNFDQYDQLDAELPHILSYMLETKNLDYYYSARALHIDACLLQDKNYSALQEMQEMYNDAQRQENIYGQAVAMYKLGVAYIQIYLEAEPALAAFKHCLEFFAKLDRVDMIELDAHFDYCNILYQAGEKDTLQQALAQWKIRLDRANANEMQKNKRRLYTKYVDYYASAICTNLLLGNTSQATSLLDSMDKMAAHSPTLIESLVLDTREEFFKHTGRYDSALAYNQKLLTTYRASGLTALSTNKLRIRGNMFYDLHRYDSAASCYYQYNILRDSTETGLNTNLLHELNTLFKVNELKASQQLLYNRLFFLSLITILFVIVALLLVIHSHRLRRKNRFLYESIQKDLQQSQAQKERAAIIKSEIAPHEELPREMQIYNDLCLLMREKKVFCDSNCNATSLARELGTNRTYLADAIKMYQNGATILEFINNLRLEYAAQLLTESTYRIAEIELIVGFNSRTTFYRLFKDKFGLTTSEFRKIAEEKRSVHC